MNILVLADHDGKALGLATARVMNAALQLGAEVHVLVAGSAEIAAQAVCIQGVSKVLHTDYAGVPPAEALAPCVASLAPAYSHVLAAASTTGKDVLPRIAALLDVSQVSEVVKILSPDTFVRPVYAGNALETVQSLDSVKLLTVRATAFDALPIGGDAPIEAIAAIAPQTLSQLISADVASSGRPELSSARVVVSGGRGLGSAENFTLVERLADALGAAVGASRAAVDAGYVPNDYQVGQTGKVVAPELYIAVGISGAIQHIAGMRESRVIVAINKDENAPIFDVADYGLVADLFVAVPEIISALGK